jgi:hypothetical protein
MLIFLFVPKLAEINEGFILFPISFLIYEHLFEYIGTQFSLPSSLLYGKMGSITLFFFSNGDIRYDTTFYA